MFNKIKNFVEDKPLISLMLNLSVVIIIVTILYKDPELAITAIQSSLGVATISFVLGAVYTFVINIFTGKVFNSNLWRNWFKWAIEVSCIFGLVFLNIWFFIIMGLFIYEGGDWR